MLTLKSFLYSKYNPLFSSFTKMTHTCFSISYIVHTYTDSNVMSFLEMVSFWYAMTQVTGHHQLTTLNDQQFNCMAFIPPCILEDDYEWSFRWYFKKNCCVNMNINLIFLSSSRLQQWRLQPFPRGSRVCRYYPKGGTSYREWSLSREDFPGFQWELLCQRPERGEERTEESHWYMRRGEEEGSCRMD